ncbi:hypothetical protein SynA18461_02268 [Synechococcus sp. A18-46.1]|nr:hypothetical protein SynA18461_02268 [Synechococcus sp. A18-46.1]
MIDQLVLKIHQGRDLYKFPLQIHFTPQLRRGVISGCQQQLWPSQSGLVV